jgi:hypothetical protein
MFRRTIGLSFSHGMKVALIGVSLAVFSHVASAQAFLPPAGEGNATVSYQDTSTRGQLNNAGEVISVDSTAARSLMWDAQFGLNDRLAVNASLPFITAKFAGGPSPHLVGVHGQPSDLDNGTYHGTFQDVHFGVRFNILRSRRMALTPFAEAIIPSHHYESLGQSVVGRDLRTLILGAAVGGFVDALLPGVYFQTEFSHAVVQEVLGIRANHSRIDSDVGYFVTPRFSVRFLESFQITHDGIDFIGPYPPAFSVHSGGAITRNHRLNHDRLLRSNFLNLGAGVSFAVNDSLDLSVSAAKMAWGENVQRLRDVTVGANWHFRTRRGGLQPSPQQTGRMIPVRSNLPRTPPVWK